MILNARWKEQDGAKPSHDPGLKEPWRGANLHACEPVHRRAAAQGRLDTAPVPQPDRRNDRKSARPTSQDRCRNPVARPCRGGRGWLKAKLRKWLADL